jgi:hypothetical protein
MEKGKADKPPLATTATLDAASLVWEKVKIAEDELSELWHEAARIENSEQASAAARETQIDNFWPFIEELANRCDSVLQEHGFPPAAEVVRHDGTGKWWRHPIDAPKRPPTGETWKVTRGHTLADEHSDDFSDAWYAGRIGLKSRLALEHFRKGDAGEHHLFSLIFEIATLRTDWQWRRVNKPSILTGRKQRKTLADHRDTANEKQREGMLARREAIATLRGEMSRNLTGGALEKSLQKRLREGYGINASTRTIRRDLLEISRP